MLLRALWICASEYPISVTTMLQVGQALGAKEEDIMGEVKEERNRKEGIIISVGLHIITFSLSL